MKKKILLFSLLFMNISTTVLANVVTVTQFKSINNSPESGSTYKTKDDYIKDVSLKTNYRSDKVSYENYDTNKDLKDLSKEVSYLVDNDILSRDLDINATPTSLDVKNSVDIINGYKDVFPVYKSELLMALAKSVYGIQESRPIVLNKKNTKEPVTDGDLIYDYSEGEYNVYVSPNVYELYFKTLLDKSLISVDEFEGNDFINEYNKYGTDIGGVKYYPAWYNNGSPFNVFSNKTPNAGGSILGQSVEIEKYGQAINLASFNSKYSRPSFFKDEELTTIDALVIIEDFLRLSEKDMTKTEAEIINYKYGADYLNKLDDSTKDTVMFLVAKGILDFEDSEEFSSLFDTFNNQFFYELIYRLHNKDARKTFSEIQLTDEDNYFLSKGYYKKSIKFSAGDYPMTETSVEKGPVALDTREIATNGVARTGTIHHQPYTVSRIYYSTTKYTYRGKKIEDLKAGDPKEVKSVELVKDSSGVNIGHKIVFEVTATTPQNAIAMIDARTVARTGNSDTLANVSGIASSKTATGAEEFFISKTTLNTIRIEVTTYGGRKESEEIQVIDDKYLVNTRTGTRAVLLENNKTALIGNEIVTNTENMVQGIAGETYYNLAIVSKLMSNSYTDKLDPAHIYTTKGVKYQGIVSVYGENSKHQLDKTTIAQFDEMKGVNDSIVHKKMYSLQDTTNMLSILYKDVSLDLKQDRGTTMMVVEWRYIFPESGDENISKYQGLYTDRNLSVSEMGNFLFKRPQDDDLGKWWDSNIGISNAICNYLYGTTGQEYINSGYLAPVISLLVAKGKTEPYEFYKDGIINKLQVSSDYRQKFVKNHTIFDAIFDNKNDGGIYGQLATNRYVSIRDNAERKGDDNLKYTPYSDCNEFAVTSNGVIYKDIAESDMKYVGTYGAGNGDFLTINTSAKRRTDSVDTGNYYNLSLGGKHPTFLGEWLAQDLVKMADGKMYYKMVSTKSVNVSIDSSKLQQTHPQDLQVSLNSVNGVTQSFLEYYKANIIGDLPSGISGVPSDAKDLISRVSNQTNAQKESIISVDLASKLGLTENELVYYYDTERDTHMVHKLIKSGDSYRLSSVTSSSQLNGHSSTLSVKLFPTIYLKQYSISKSGGNTLVNKETIAYFARENVMLTGINSSVIDSIVANSYKYTPTSKLKTGDRVIIGDVNFAVEGGYLVSEPIQDRALNSQNIAVDLNNTANANSIVSRRFMDIGMSIYHNGYLVKGQSFADYILEGSGFGSPAKDFDKNKLKNCLIRKPDGKLVISTKGNESPYQIGSFVEQIVMKIKLSDSILFRPIENNSRTFVLVQITNNGSDGYISKSPFQNETLSYTWDDAIFGRISQTKYQEAADSKNLIERLLDKFRFEKDQSFKALLGQITIALLSYLIVVNWIGFAFKKVTTIRVILEQIKHPASNAQGPDILKIATFGMRDIDIEDKLLNIVGVTFLMFCIIIVTLNVI